METALRKYRVIFAVCIVLYWAGFAYIWGFWGWNNSVLFGDWWLFDTVGHALFGIGGTITLLFLYQNSMRTWLFVGSRVILAIAVVASVSLCGVLWEFFEGLWDLYHNGLPGVVRAQNSAIDNTIDILAATLASLVSVLLYHFYNMWYWHRHPSEHVHEIAKSIKDLTDQAEREIRDSRKEVRKALRRRIRRTLLRTPHKMSPSLNNK